MYVGDGYIGIWFEGVFSFVIVLCGLKLLVIGFGEFLRGDF